MTLVYIDNDDPGIEHPEGYRGQLALVDNAQSALYVMSGPARGDCFYGDGVPSFTRANESLRKTTQEVCTWAD